MSFASLEVWPSGFGGGGSATLAAKSQCICTRSTIHLWPFKSPGGTMGAKRRMGAWSFMRKRRSGTPVA